MGIFLLILIGAILSFTLSSRGNGGSKENDVSVVESNLDINSEDTSKQNNCGSKQIFTHEITDLENIASVGPLGGLNVGSASRSYIMNKKTANSSFVSTPLYAPMDSTLTGIYYKKADYGNKGSRGEYRLEIDAGCDGITYVFDHIAEVSEKIKSAGATNPSLESNIGTSVQIQLKSGELLGQTDGTKIAGTWDFYLINPTQTAFHINPSRWESDHNTHAECPYDYFDDELKTKYMAKLALWDGQRTTELNCGQISHDIEGTLSGGWFQGDATDMKGTKLILGNTATMVEVLRETISYSDQKLNNRFGFRTYNYKKKPENVKPGESVCYSADNKYIFLNLISPEKLLTAKGAGSCPSSFPASEVEEWQR